RSRREQRPRVSTLGSQLSQRVLRREWRRRAPAPDGGSDPGSAQRIEPRDRPLRNRWERPPLGDRGHPGELPRRPATPERNPPEGRGTGGGPRRRVAADVGALDRDGGGAVPEDGKRLRHDPGSPAPPRRDGGRGGAAGAPGPAGGVSRDAGRRATVPEGRHLPQPGPVGPLRGLPDRGGPDPRRVHLPAAGV